jgi:hypothetical protein
MEELPGGDNFIAGSGFWLAGLELAVVWFDGFVAGQKKQYAQNNYQQANR